MLFFFFEYITIQLFSIIMLENYPKEQNTFKRKKNTYTINYQKNNNKQHI